MTKNIEICKAEEVGAQVLDIRTTAERQAVAAINAAFGLAIPLPAAEPGEITELPAAVSAHDRQLLAQLLGKPEPAATLSTTDPLATFVATLCRELYLHFADRQAVYPLADFPDPFARNLAHLLQAVQSLSPRKISNGSATSDGIKDGVSLAHLLCGSVANDVTEIADDNPSYVYARSFPWSTFPNIKKATLNFSSTNITVINNHANIEELVLPYAESMTINAQSYYFIANCAKLRKIDGKAFKRFSAGNGTMMIRNCPLLEEIDFRNSAYINTYVNIALIYNCPSLRRIIIGTTGTNPYNSTTDNLFGQAAYQASSTDNLIDIELGEGFAYSLNLCQWNPTNVLADADKTATFLQNFRDHIALRLTDQGSGLTLTLSQAVRNAIHAAESTYGIEDIIVNQKHWTLSPAPSA